MCCRVLHFRVQTLNLQIDTFVKVMRVSHQLRSARPTVGHPTSSRGKKVSLYCPLARPRPRPQSTGFFNKVVSLTQSSDTRVQGCTNLLRYPIPLRTWPPRESMTLQTCVAMQALLTCTVGECRELHVCARIYPGNTCGCVCLCMQTRMCEHLHLSVRRYIIYASMRTCVHLCFLASANSELLAASCITLLILISLITTSSFFNVCILASWRSFFVHRTPTSPVFCH